MDGDPGASQSRGSWCPFKGLERSEQHCEDTGVAAECGERHSGMVCVCGYSRVVKIAQF